ncbi:MAG: hypothetical protein DWH73_03015 [Planctomycetota bacterium]|nr:MAG: hypothetical protein DWH73_03015 [Planctomycetota bacterium]
MRFLDLAELGCRHQDRLLQSVLAVVQTGLCDIPYFDKFLAIRRDPCDLNRSKTMTEMTENTASSVPD